MIEDPCFKVSPQTIARGIEDLLDENERLNKKLEEKEAILGGIQQLEAEVERLNNIINELEKFLKINSEKDDYDLTEYNKGVNNAYNYTLDKLKELKEKKDE